MERVMTAVVIHRAPLAMRRILLDSGPPILKTLTVTNEARLQTQPGPGDTKGPHFDGRALDIFLFAARPAELDVGENLVEFLLNRRDEIKWSTLETTTRVQPNWCSIHPMAKSAAASKKRRARPATGRDAVTAIRLSV